MNFQGSKISLELGKKNDPKFFTRLEAQIELDEKLVEIQLKKRDRKKKGYLPRALVNLNGVN